MRVSPSYDELERALSSVPGIVTASIVSQETGRARLRIRVAPGDDPEAVSWAVAATLRERFGIALDPDTIRPRISTDLAPATAASGEDVAASEPTAPPPADTDAGEVAPGVTEPSRQPPATAVPTPPEVAPATAGPSPPEVAPTTAAPGSPDRTAPGVAEQGVRVRAAIRDLVTRHGHREVEAIATLEVGTRQGRSAARAIPTRRGLWRAVAEATVGALGQLTDDHLRAEVDRVHVSTRDDPAVATVLVTVLSDRGEETLLGASLLRDDPENAVMRATLDALNRRVEPWLAAPGPPLAAPGA
jgi:hypothetical protein